jgi:UDP-glucose 4-epimerase
VIAAGRRVAVLGAGGFIGTNLCLALAQAGCDVLGVGRPPYPDSPLASIPWRAVEFGDADGIAGAVAGCDVVYQLLGGSVPVESNRDPVGDVLTSLVPTLRLIEACQASGVGRFIFASSGGTIYGSTPSVPVTEKAETNPITAYGINKLAIEKYLGLFRHLHGFDAITLRIANPYGPFQHRRRAQGLVGTVLARGLTGETIEIWGDGSVVRDYVHIDDVVAALLEAATYCGRHNVFNVGSGEGRSVRQVVDDICVLCPSPPKVIYHPSRPADIPYNVLDSSLLTTETGWVLRTDWPTGLERTARWMRGD